MKQKTLLLILCILSGFRFAAMAEGLWGVKASFDINTPGKWHVADTSVKAYRTGLGGAIGGVYTHYFNDNIFLEPSLSVFYDTYSHYEVYLDESMTEKDPSIYKVGLRLPVVVGYTFDITDDFALAVFIGPEINYALAGGTRFKTKAMADAVNGKIFGKEGYQNRFNCAWKGGLGFPFSDWRVDFEASLGLTDIAKGDPSFKENRFSISLLRYF